MLDVAFVISLMSVKLFDIVKMNGKDDTLPEYWRDKVLGFKGTVCEINPPLVTIEHENNSNIKVNLKIEDVEVVGFDIGAVQRAEANEALNRLLRAKSYKVNSKITSKKTGSIGYWSGDVYLHQDPVTKVDYLVGVDGMGGWIIEEANNYHYNFAGYPADRAPQGQQDIVEFLEDALKREDLQKFTRKWAKSQLSIAKSPKELEKIKQKIFENKEDYYQVLDIDKYELDAKFLNDLQEFC